jgi:hypothetical protein
MLLVLAEKDTGTASVFMAMFAGVTLWCGGDLFFLFVFSVLPLGGDSRECMRCRTDARYVMIGAVILASGAIFMFRRTDCDEQTRSSTREVR